jgi:hypothetical protein
MRYHRDINPLHRRKDHTMAKISTRNITNQNVEDILDTAGYGIGYWASTATINEDGSYTFTEVGDYSDPADHKEHTITRAQIKSAVVKLAEDYVDFQQAFIDWTREDGIDTGEIDSMRADMVVQEAAFGEVVYA